MLSLNKISNRNVLMESDVENDKKTFDFLKDSLLGILDEKTNKEDLDRLWTKWVYSYFNSLHLNYWDEIMFVKIKDKQNYLEFQKEFLLWKLLKDWITLEQDREMLSYLMKKWIITKSEITLILNDFLDLHKNCFIEFFDKSLNKSSFFNEELYVISSLFSEKLIKKNVSIDLDIAQSQPEAFVYSEINSKNTQNLFNINQKAVNKIYEELLFNVDVWNNIFFWEIKVYDTLLKILNTK